MKPNSKIMVACDLSAYAEEAVRCATALARDLKAELVIVNVINERDIAAMNKALVRIKAEFDNFPVTIASYIDGLKKEHTRELEAVLNQAGGGQTDHRYVITTGIPFKRLIDIAVEESPRFIVIGTKGRSDLANVILGSTAEKMFRHCPFPLLSVRLAPVTDV